MTTRVLVVEDEPVVRDVVVRYLRSEGYETAEAADGRQAQRSFTEMTPSLVLLDVMVPHIDGFELCRWIRERSSVPIIMLTAKGEETDRIVGLELGADDYVTKPFSPRELIARVRSVMRRSEITSTRQPPIVHGGLIIDAASREATLDGHRLELRALEFDLLRFLACHPRTVFTREQIMLGVWGGVAASDSGTLTVHIRRLREKIEQDPSRPRRIETIWGVGYRFSP
ncbi:MAG: response regulator transcription factor [Actinomycetota bacterium]